MKKRSTMSIIIVFVLGILAILGINPYSDVIKPVYHWIFPPKIELKLQTEIDFSNIYVSDFDKFTLKPPGNSIPQKLSLKWATLYGLHPMVWIKVFNQNNHPVTLSHAIGVLKADLMETELDVFQRYFDRNLESAAFPLYLEEHREIIIALPITWPISGDLKGALPEFANDTLYTSPYIYNGYEQKQGIYSFGTPSATVFLLRDLLIEDFRNLMHIDSAIAIKAILNLELASGERFSDSLVVSKPIRTEDSVRP